VVHRNGGISTNPRYVSNIINENIEMRRDFNMKPFFKVNVETGKRLVILFIVKLFGQYLGKRIVQLFSTIRHFEKFL
jgi:hypothetical protein